MASSAGAVTLIGTQPFLDRFFGVNLHLTNCCRGNYGSTTQIINELKYIGATHLRDGPVPMGGLLDKWKAVRNATGAPFMAVIETGSPARQRECFAVMKNWIKIAPGLINIVEGSNEPDNSFGQSQGASLADSAALQHEVYAAGKAAGLRVTQMSVGASWYPPLWEGNYKKFGKPPADFGNAHVYVNRGEVPAVSLKRIGELARWSVDGKQVNVTEFGIFKGAQYSSDLTSAYMHIAPFTSYLSGHFLFAVYALHDDMTNAVGFYDSWGNARAHARYWHVTTRLLADPVGKKLPPKSANITFSNIKTVGKGSSGVKNVPMYKSDGSIWIAAYDEEPPGALDGAETITFDKFYPFLQVIDGRNGAVIQTLTNSNKVSLRLPANRLFFVVASTQKVSVKL